MARRISLQFPAVTPYKVLIRSSFQGFRVKRRFLFTIDF
jgi:hypothetical protein